jgi:transcriptional antiterminator RfaH
MQLIMNLMKKWYLIKTKPKQEKVAIINLENQNYLVYCPLTKVHNKNVFLFTGYLFIQLDDKVQDWSPIRSTRGVSNFVRFGLSYAIISNTIIDFIKTNEHVTTEKLKCLSDFHPGDRVQITEGVFKNCIAIFNSFKSEERVILLMNLMGQQQKLYIEKKSLVGL